MISLIRLALLACCLASFASPLRAQDQSITTAIKEARAELEAEKVRIAEERESQEARLAELEAERNALSGELVDLELEAVETGREFEALRAERVSIRESVEQAKRELSELPRLVSDAIAKIDDMLSVLPPLEAGLSSETLAGADFDELVATLEVLLRESNSNSTFRVPIHLADGSELEADIARIGVMSWAYRVVGTDRVGVAMNAPGPDESYRWHEDLDPLTSAALLSAMSGIARGGAVQVLVPVDVTAQMETESATREDSLLATVTAGGPVIIPIVGVALFAALLILERVIYLARKGIFTTRTAEAIVELVRDEKYDEALELCEQKNAPVTSALSACLNNRGQSAEVIEDAVQEAVLNQLPKLERFLPTIAMLASIAPLLGLLGTVTGMIITFEMIATLGSGNPRIMAGGISQALITTAAGLVVAIPILLTHSFLAGRVDRLVSDMERFGSVLLNALREKA